MTLDWPVPDPARPTVGVIGWPVDHSLSPQIHTAAYRACGLDWDYLRLPVPPAEMPQAVERLVAGGFRGANVTTPHKDAAAELSAELTPDAALLEAVNTLEAFGDGQPRMRGHNTDAPGFADFLTIDADFDAAGETALLYGAGGAARACALALARLGLGTLVLALRDPAKADPVRRMLTSLDAPAPDLVAIDLESAAEPPVAPTLIVNATPLGAQGERLPHPGLGRGMMVMDLLYRAPTTPLQEAAREAGARAYGGLGLLVHQAAHAFTIWTGEPAPLEAMWAAVKEAAPASDNP